MSDIKQAWGTASQAITITLASLGISGARESTAIDNTSNKFIDAWVYVAIKVGTVATPKVLRVWFYGSEDGTNYGDNATGSDASITLRSPGNLFGPFLINVPTSTTTYKAVFTVAQFFPGGRLPPKWGIVVDNGSGATLDSTEGNHTKEYRGIYDTVA